MLWATHSNLVYFGLFLLLSDPPLFLGDAFGGSGDLQIYYVDRVRLAARLADSADLLPCILCSLGLAICTFISKFMPTGCVSWRD